MGADQSSAKAEREKYSRDEVTTMMQQQKALFEQKHAELLRATNRAQQTSLAAEKTAREAARKEVEKIMKEKQELLSRQNTNLNHNPLSPNVPTPVTPVSLEKRSSPYNLTNHDLKSPTLAPSVTPSKQTSIYPNLDNASTLSRNSMTPSSSTMKTNAASTASSPLSNYTASPLTKNYMPPVSATASSINLAPSSPSPLKNCMPSSSTASIYNNLSASRTSGSPMSQGTKSDRVTPTRVLTSNVKSDLPTTLSPRVAVAPSAPPLTRDRSASRNRIKGRQTVNKNDELNCPTCQSRYGVNIYQCQKGHSSCGNCKERRSACGICGLPITDMRNITLEAYIGERKVQCSNSKDGCSLYIKLADLETHVKECPFGDMLCPLAPIFGQCTWRGMQSQMADHFDDVHQMHRKGNVNTEMVLLSGSLTTDSHVVYFVNLGNYSFLFHSKVSPRDGKMYMVVQFVGTRQSACKWSYEIQIYNKSEPRRKYQFSDICHPINNSLNTIISNSECATIPLSYASTFINDNGFLTYKFYIKKDSELQGNNNTHTHSGDSSKNNNSENDQKESGSAEGDLRRRNNFRNNQRGRGRGGNNAGRYNLENRQRNFSGCEENIVPAFNQNETGQKKTYWNRRLAGGSRRDP